MITGVSPFRNMSSVLENFLWRNTLKKQHKMILRFSYSKSKNMSKSLSIIFEK